MTKGKGTTAAGTILIPCSSVSTEGNRTGAWRFLRPCYEDKTSPCSAACPAGEDIGRIEMLVTRGEFKEAWETILRENPFPGVCGRVCYHPCEAACNRGEFDEAIRIHTIERFIADRAARNNLKPALERLSLNRQKIAVIGAGPAGLAGAFFLTRLGYACDVFESNPEAGGVLRWGIPSYRLPLQALRNDIAQIESQGVRIFTNRHMTRDSVDELSARYQGIFIACGYGASVSPGIPGEDMVQVGSGLHFLKRIRQGDAPPVQGLSVVIGGGNTAVDVARSITRLGGKAVIAYRRRRRDMPAFDEEVEMLLDEGIELRELLAPLKITGDSEGCLVTLGHMKVVGTDERGRGIVERDGDRTEKIQAERVFTATGERAAETWLNPPADGDGVSLLHNSVLVNHPDGPVRVFVGDLAAGVKSVVHAVASAKEAAIALDMFFQRGPDSIDEGLKNCLVGEGPSHSMEIHMKGERHERNPHIVSFEEINTDYFQLAPAVTQPRLLRDERLRTFAEVDLRISVGMAIGEAERCFNCGLCNQCDNCYLYCPDMSVVHDDGPRGRHIDYDYCKGCGLCVVECPRNAMRLEEEE